MKAAAWLALCALLVAQSRQLVRDARVEYATRNAETIDDLNLPIRDTCFSADLAKARGDYWQSTANPPQPDRALAEYRLAVQLDPNDSIHWLDFAQACSQAGDNLEARKAFGVADILDPSNHQIQQVYGDYLLLEGLPGEALRHHARAIHFNRAGRQNTFQLYWNMGLSPAQVAGDLLDGTPEMTRQYWLNALTVAEPEDAARLWERFKIPADGPNESCFGAYFDYLIAKKRPDLARALWHRIAQSFYHSDWDEPKELFWNGGPNRPRLFSSGGLEWRIPETLPADVRASFGGSLPGLQISFAGTNNLSFSAIAHGFIIDPGKVYRLSYSVAAKEITTHNGPYVSLNIPGEKSVYKKAPVVTGTADETTQTLEFTAPPGACWGEIRICRDYSDKFNNKIQGEVCYRNFVLQELK